MNSWIFLQTSCRISYSLSSVFYLKAQFCSVYWLFKWLQSFLGIQSLEALTERNFFCTLSVHIFSNFGCHLMSIILEFIDLLFSSINFFHLILTVIIFWLKRGRCNYCSFYMSPKSGIFESQAPILCLLFIVIRTLKFLKCVLVSTFVNSFRHDEGKKESKFLLNKNKSQKSEVGLDVREIGS